MSESPAQPKIEIRGLNLQFPGKSRGSTVDVLRGIDLAVADGEFVCLVGPSGCGKTTLLNVVGGFLPPTSGKVEIDGEAVSAPDPRRVFIFQENGVFPWLTVEENIGFGLGKKPEAERRAIVRQYIEIMRLSGFERSYPRELSGGMKQRVELARALATEPDVLYMDEPFGALDYLTRLRLRAELIQLWQRIDPTILFVTHDVEEAVQLADRIVVMEQRPSRIREVVPVPLPRPRDPGDPQYQRLRDRIFALMGLDPLGLDGDGG
ncbi:MAG TPA: ABC transporter ATP-binding protein [Thermoanaerobaculia bacterium]|nr:ABC transporter ATP-binding protein [Thermoanaerobaculia bacterium]